MSFLSLPTWKGPPKPLLQPAPSANHYAIGSKRPIKEVASSALPPMEIETTNWCEPHFFCDRCEFPMLIALQGMLEGQLSNSPNCEPFL